MKKLLFFVAMFCLIIAHTVYAQNINLTFTGSATDGRYVQLDSVRVDNISRNWTEILLYPDTVLTLTDETGVGEVEGSVSNCFSYPNPFHGTTNVFLTMLQSEIVTLQVYSMAGQLIMGKQVQVEAGENRFEISLVCKQTCFLLVRTSHGQLVQKLINTGSSGENNIAYISCLKTAPTKKQKHFSQNHFKAGDVLKIVGYVTHHGVVFASNEILQPQTTGEFFKLLFGLPAIGLPVIATDTVSSITDSSAVSGGNIATDSGAAVTARGVCWDTIPNPTIHGSHTTDSVGTGSFTSQITGLEASTVYYVRAYATNAAGTAYGNELSFTTLSGLPAIGLPVIATDTVSSITDSSAVSGGNIATDSGAAVTARGVCWDTIPNPTIRGSHTTDSAGTGCFTSHITGLKANTVYYVRAYATNAVGTAYGNQVSFTTPGVKANGFFAVSATTRVCFSPGNLQWSATNGGTTATTHAVAGNGTAAGTWRFAPQQYGMIGNDNSNISSTYTGWIDLFGWGTSGYDKKYPYMTNSSYLDYGNGSSSISGTNYDWGVYNAIFNPKTNTTDAPGTWRTLTEDEWIYLLNTRTTSSGIRYAKATVMGVSGLIIVPDNWDSSVYVLKNINSGSAKDASNTINATVWSRMESAGCVFLPAAGSRYVASCNNVGSVGRYWTATNRNDPEAYNLLFSSGFLGFGSAERCAAYAVRLVRKANVPVPILTTKPVSGITDSSAVSGGIIVTDGGAAVVACGVCWDTIPNPTIRGSHTTDSVGTGGFTSHITGLKANTAYYVRAYATNAALTAYGNEVVFIAKNAATNDAIFSVSGIDSVCFSPGNLQWSATGGGTTATSHAVAGNGTAAGTWRFAPNQWDMCGYNNDSISSSYTGWIDLFGWGTSGYNKKYPFMTSISTTDYGNGNSSISGTNYDWGVYNAIYNFKTQTTDTPGTWRTLTSAEWSYLMDKRKTSSGIRYAKATVLGVSGLIIVPDNWNSSVYNLQKTNSVSAKYESNTINASDWSRMDSAGCVFLPAAGTRYGTISDLVSNNGSYWSAEYIGSDYVYYLFFNQNYLDALGYGSKNSGYAVRLVRKADVPVTMLTTNIVGCITDSSAVSGGNIATDGGIAVTARGVCWDTISNPTIRGSHTTDSAGTGSFTSHITGLRANTVYYVRAYATNAEGTAYGNEVLFKTTFAADKNALFSVSAAKQVVFSPGNLQWSATNGGNVATSHVVADSSSTASGTWRFAPNQWDIIGANNSNIDSSYSGWIDLFGWGTSGYNNYYPYLCSTNKTDYGNYGNGGASNISGTYYDWGVYNAIYNPKTNKMDNPGTWRTLTIDEWIYLLNTRKTSNGIRYAKATVVGVAGLIIVPDNWDGSVYTLKNSNSNTEKYTSNTINASDWAKMESSGCVFLPAAGTRYGTSVGGFPAGGHYWSTTYDACGEAYYINIWSSELYHTFGSIAIGQSVRLVRDAK